MPEDSLVPFLVDQLAALGPVRAKRMFGGHGLYLGTTFFGIIHGGAAYFKTSADTVGEYVRLGMRPFKPTEKQTLKSYHEVPPEVIDDRERLVAWAEKAVAAQEAGG